VIGAETVAELAMETEENEGAGWAAIEEVEEEEDSNDKKDEDDDDEDNDVVVAFAFVGLGWRRGAGDFAGDASFAAGVFLGGGDLGTFLGAGTPFTAPLRIFTSMISPPSKSCTCMNAGFLVKACGETRKHEKERRYTCSLILI